MKRKLPPLNSLKAFEAAARYCSFTKAADELCVTQGAVSKQIKILEDHLDAKLFKRTSAALVLTEKGNDYYLSLKEFFNNIESSTNYIFGDIKADKLLTINILPSLSTNWLIPKIQDFKDKNPDINVCINIGDGNDIDFEMLKADVAIRVGDNPIEGLENELLFSENMVLVCSPSLIKESEFKIADINNYNLLGHTGRPYMWKRCLESSGVTYHEKKDMLTFEHFFMITKAVKEKMGFALVPDIIVKADIENGKLINPSGISYQTGFSYYMVYPKQKAKAKKMKAFSGWLKTL